MSADSFNKSTILLEKIYHLADDLTNSLDGLLPEKIKIQTGDCPANSLGQGQNNRGILFKQR